MIFVKIGRGYVENISQYIYYTRNTTPFGGGVSTQKCYPVFLTFCKQLLQHTDIILIFFLFFFRQFIICTRIL